MRDSVPSDSYSLLREVKCDVYIKYEDKKLLYFKRNFVYRVCFFLTNIKQIPSL